MRGGGEEMEYIHLMVLHGIHDGCSCHDTCRVVNRLQNDVVLISLSVSLMISLLFMG